MMNDKAKEIDYDIEDLSIESARECTIKCNGKRFRVFLEVVTSCFGNCSGCSLSYTDRRILKPELTMEEIRKTLTYFVPVINNKKNLRTTVLNLGTGDYFLMEEDFLEELFKTVRIFFDNLETPRNVLTISTSLFLNEAKMVNKIDKIKKHLHKSQFAIEGVVDPLQLSQHYERYVENYKSLIKYFPFFDLVVNISNEVRPEHIKIMSEFLTEMGILNFDLQYAINKTNTYRVKTSQENFSGLMESIYEVLGNKAQDLLEISIAMPLKSSLDKNIFQVMEANSKEIVNERVMVKKDGNIYPIAFGYGDILLDERYDMAPIGNINKEWNEAEGSKIVFDYLKKIFIKNPQCHNCEYNNLCYSTGYSFYNKFTEDKKCDNVGMFVFRKTLAK